MSTVTKTYVRIREQAYLSMRGNRGQTMAEYGLIVALVAVVTVGAWGILGGKINTVLTAINGAL